MTKSTFKPVLLGGLGLILVTACAKPPSQIEAAQLAGNPYGQMSCSQLRAQQELASEELKDVNTQQSAAVIMDTSAVLLSGLPLATLMGDNVESEVALAKGKVNEIDRQLVAKSCR